MDYNSQEITDRLEDIREELKTGIKSVRNDLIQLGVTAVGILMLMEAGLAAFYSLLIGAVLAYVLREIHAHKDRIYPKA